jgi:uncharacterized membrane protein YdbT with pleckstrin-like domain
MPVEQSQVISLLKEIHLFHGLDETRLQQVARHFAEVSYEADQVIISENKQGEFFCIIFEGEVVVSRRINDVDTQLDILITGDFFGEESLLQNMLTSATVTAARSVILLKADRQSFHELLLELPEVETHLKRVIQSRRFIRVHPFDWLNEDEVVYQVSRKHVASLFLSLLPPLLVTLLGMALALYLLAGVTTSTLQVGFLGFAGLVILGGLLWGLWKWLDWSNDYYIVTNQRVVWIEQVIFLYESRVEAPLTTIQAVNVRTELLGRLLGYGDVTVNTYTGRVILTTIGDPHQMAALIQEYWHRAQMNFQREQKEEMVRSVYRILGRDVPSTPPKRKVIPLPAKGDDYQEPSFFSTYFSNIFTLRYEDGNTITYRKHWLVLIGKTWKPFLAFLVILFGTLFCVGTGAYNQIDIASIEIMIGIGILLILLVIFPWWLYNYVDWRNDIYQLTDKNIFDIERKPLGTELRKSGSLDRILSLEHERPGFVGFLFNVGTVVINFGDAKFDFVGVYEPARIQQDIFNRMHLLRTQQQKAEAAREREQVLSILTIYHDNVGGNQNENPVS